MCFWFAAALSAIMNNVAALALLMPLDIQAAEKAIANPLLDEISLKGAHGVLINITGGDDLTLFELDEAANRIREEVDPNANIIVGSTLDPSMEGAMR